MGVINEITQLRSNIQTVTPNMSASDQRVIMTNFNGAHSKVESINSATSEYRLDQQEAITTTIADAVSQAVSKALKTISPGLMKAPIDNQLLLHANKPATKSTASISTLTSATLTKMEVTTLVAEMLEERIGGLCESMANSAGHMAVSTGFINTLPTILTKIVQNHAEDQTMGADNVILSIEDCLQHICGTLDEVSTLANTIHNEFNGDLNEAILSKTETQVHTLETLNKLCDIVATIQDSSNEGHKPPQLEEVYERLNQMKRNLHQQPLSPSKCHRENHIESLEPTPRELPLYAKEGENGSLDLTQSSDDDDSATAEATTRMPNPTEFFLPGSTSTLQTGATVLGSALKADRPYKKEELDHFFITIIGPNPHTNPFNILVPINFSANPSDP